MKSRKITQIYVNTGLATKERYPALLYTSGHVLPSTVATLFSPLIVHLRSWPIYLAVHIVRLFIPETRCLAQPVHIVLHGACLDSRKWTRVPLDYVLIEHCTIKLPNASFAAFIVYKVSHTAQLDRWLYVSLSFCKIPSIVRGVESVPIESICNFRVTGGTQETSCMLTGICIVRFTLKEFVMNAARLRAQQSISNIDSISLSSHESLRQSLIAL